LEAQDQVRIGDSKLSRLRLWLTSTAAKRYSPSGLVAYYWTGGSPKACSVKNVSTSGMYVFTDERWLTGSMLPMTLQLSDSGQDAEDWIAVVTQVIRSGPDGFGLAFVFSGATGLFGDEIPPERVADPRAIKRFIKQLNN